MAQYKMKSYGSVTVGGSTIHFDKDQIIEIKGDISDDLGEKVKSERKSVKVKGEKVETAAKEPKDEKR